MAANFSSSKQVIDTDTIANNGSGTVTPGNGGPSLNYAAGDTVQTSAGTNGDAIVSITPGSGSGSASSPAPTEVVDLSNSGASVAVNGATVASGVQAADISADASGDLTLAAAASASGTPGATLATVQLTADGGTDAKIYNPSGALTEEDILSSTGGTDIKTYDPTQNDALTQEQITTPDGYITTIQYDASNPGVYAAQTTDPNGQLMQSVLTYADGSSSVVTYGLANGSWRQDDISDGQVNTSIIDHTDGSYSQINYNNDGGDIKATETNFDSDGDVTGTINYYTDGSYTITPWVDGQEGTTQAGDTQGDLLLAAVQSGQSVNVAPPSPNYAQYVGQVADTIAVQFEQVLFQNNLPAGLVTEAATGAVIASIFNSLPSAPGMSGAEAFVADFGIDLAGEVGGIAGADLGSAFFKAIGLPSQIGSLAGSVVGSYGTQYLAEQAVQDFFQTTATSTMAQAAADQAVADAAVTGSQFGDGLATAGVGAVGSFLGSELSSLVIGSGGIDSEIGGAVGSVVGAIGGQILIPIPFVGALVGSFIGDFIGSILGSLFGGGYRGQPYAEATIDYSAANNNFYMSGDSVDNNGSPTPAIDMGNAAIGILDGILTGIGGNVASYLTYIYGYKGSNYFNAFLHTNYNLVPGPNQGGDDNYFSDPTDAVQDGVFNTLRSLQISGGNEYMQLALERSTATTLQGLVDDLNAAYDYSVYVANPLAFDVALAAANDPTAYQTWQNELAQAQAMGLDQFSHGTLVMAAPQTLVTDAIKSVVVNGNTTGSEVITAESGSLFNLVMATGLDASSLWFARSGNDLVLNFFSGHTTTVQGWFAGEQTAMQAIVFADGTALGTVGITDMVNDDALTAAIVNGTLSAQGAAVLNTGGDFFGTGQTDQIIETSGGQIGVFQFDSNNNLTARTWLQANTDLSAAGSTIIGVAQNLLGTGHDILVRAADGQLSIDEFNDDGTLTQSEALTSNGAPATVDATAVLTGTSQNMFATGNDIIMKTAGGENIVWEIGSGGAVTAVQEYTESPVTNADGSYVTTTTYQTDPAGRVTVVNTYNTAGTLTEQDQTFFDGSSSKTVYDTTGGSWKDTVTYYDASGQESHAVTRNNDGSQSVTFFTLAPGYYKSITTTFNSSNQASGYSITYSSGMTETVTSDLNGGTWKEIVSYYNAEGQETESLQYNNDNSYTDTIYNLAGGNLNYTVSNYSSIGQLTSVTQYNNDGTTSTSYPNDYLTNTSYYTSPNGQGDVTYSYYNGGESYAYSTSPGATGYMYFWVHPPASTYVSHSVSDQSDGTQHFSISMQNAASQFLFDTSNELNSSNQLINSGESTSGPDTDISIQYNPSASVLENIDLPAGQISTGWTELDIQYDQDGSYTITTSGKIVPLYPTQGTYVDIISKYSANGNLLNTNYYEAGSDNSPLLSIQYDAVGGAWANTYTYVNQNGQTTIQVQNNFDGSKVITTYDLNDNDTRYDNVDTYNTSGQLTEDVENNRDGSYAKTLYDTTDGAYTVYDYNSSGMLTGTLGVGVASTVSADYASGQLEWTQQYNNDGSSVVTSYGSPGSSGTEEIEFINAAGERTNDIAYNSDGTSYDITWGLPGSSLLDKAYIYNASGQLTTIVQNNTDGSAINTIYNLSGGSLDYTVDQYSSDGPLSSETLFYDDGGKTVTTYNYFDSLGHQITTTTIDKYDAAGQLTEETINNVDGSNTVTNYFYSGAVSRIVDVYNTNDQLTDSTQYDTNGNITASTSYDSNGNVTQQYTETTVINPDGSSTAAITYQVNQSGITSETYNYNDSGQLTSSQQTSVDGISVDTVYNANGSTASYYNLAGQLTHTITENNDGSESIQTYNLMGGTVNYTTDNYNPSGQPISHAVVLTNGKTYTTTYNTTGGPVIETVAITNASGQNTETIQYNSDKGYMDTVYNLSGGSLNYTVSNYNADNQITSSTSYYADGSSSTQTYSVTVASTVTDWSNGSGTLVTQYNSDGTALSIYTDNAGGTTYDYINSAGNTTHGLSFDNNPNSNDDGVIGITTYELSNNQPLTNNWDYIQTDSFDGSNQIIETNNQILGSNGAASNSAVSTGFNVSNPNVEEPGFDASAKEEVSNIANNQEMDVLYRDAPYTGGAFKSTYTNFSNPGQKEIDFYNMYGQLTYSTQINPDTSAIYTTYNLSGGNWIDSRAYCNADGQPTQNILDYVDGSQLITEYDSNGNVVTNIGIGALGSTDAIHSVFSTVKQLTLTDTAAYVVVNLSTLQSIATLTNVSITVSDTGADVAANLDALEALAAAGMLSSITLTDAATPTLAITAAQKTNDAAALGKIASAYNLSVSGVLTANAGTMLAAAHVTSITVADSAAGIVGKLAVLESLIAQGKVTSVAVTDTAANVAADIGSLESIAATGKLASITLTDAATPTLTLTPAQLTNDAAALGKIASAYNLSISPVTAANAASTAAAAHVTSVVVADASANVVANLAALEALANAGKLGSIRLTNTTAPTLALTAVQAGNDLAALEKIASSYKIAISDTGADVAANLAALQTLAASGKIASITLTDKTAPTLAITAAQKTNDATALGLIASAYNLAVSGVLAANAASMAASAHVKTLSVTDTTGDIISNLAALETLAAAGQLTAISLTNAGATLTLTAAQLAADAQALALITSPYNIYVTGVAAANAASVAAQPHFIGMTVVDAAGNVLANLAALQTIAAAGQLTSITLTDTATPTLALTAAQKTADATALGKIMSAYNLTVSGVLAANAASVATAAHVTSVTVADSAAGITGKLAVLESLISQGKVTSVAVTDTGANVVANLASLQGIAATGKLASVTLTDAATPTLALTPAQLTSDAAALGKIASAYNETVTADANTAETVTATGETNTISFAKATAGVSVNLALDAATQTHGTTQYADTLNDFQNAVGSAYADTLTAGANGSILTGNGGADTYILAATGADIVRDTSAHLNGTTVNNFSALDQIDLTDLAFGANTTLGFTENGAGTAGTLTLSDGTHNATILLMGQYMAAGFTKAADTGAGTVIAYVPPQNQSAALAAAHG